MVFSHTIRFLMDARKFHNLMKKMPVHHILIRTNRKNYCWNNETFKPGVCVHHSLIYSTFEKVIERGVKESRKPNMVKNKILNEKTVTF